MNVIIDYKAGNLLNLKNALDFLDIPNDIVTDPESVRKADRILFPGVGAFGAARNNLKQSGMLEAIRESVAAGKPFLGICVGAQLLFEESEEDGIHEGLGLLKGKVVRFRHELKIPQMGWNQVHRVKPDLLFQDIPDHSYFYFVHSYHFLPENEANVLAHTDYGVQFSSVVRQDNVWGVQFHPEKSQDAGLRLLKNFCDLT
ncbi:MAG: imidazole glycerol phosphate synthase subunit HisH [SAR324 cluster bacterium]|nr:imidazole glycerol phosphate synthase subunit HisH [SAR324 cluster bacterium]